LPTDWGDDYLHDEFAERYGRFQLAWQQAEAAERDLNYRQRQWRAGRLKRWTVCWWKHRTRYAGPGVYMSTSCRACAKRAG
jgi:hypothetical protein